MPMEVTDAKLALLDFNLQQKMFGMGTQIVIKDADKLEGVRDMEFEISRRHIELIIASGANVILTTGGIDDMAQKYLVEAGVMGVRRVEMEDLKRIAKITNATIVTSMADMEGNESFDPANLGSAKSISEQRIGEDHFIVVKEGAGRKAGCIMLRGPNTQQIGEVERSVHDALCAVSKTLESQAVVAGGGSVETALNCYLEEYAKTIEGKEQLAVTAFAKALLAIPKQLCLNSALDATELVAQLRAKHTIAQRKETEQSIKDDFRHYGLNLKTGVVQNNLKCGILEPAVSKIKSLSFATEAAITILRIDDNIVLNPEKKDQK